MTSDLRQRLEERLGSDFRIVRELGGGGMSGVFLAEEQRLGRLVVVKVLSPDQAAGVSAERFEREIRLAARLQDPRIVPLLQAGEAGGLPFYTMPYVEGESLRVRLGRGAPSVEEAFGILRDVALALEYAHAHGVVHRDIKPENILLSGRTAVVTDFGIAKALGAAGTVAADTGLTSRGLALGTPAYMAPEQVAGDTVDSRADLYAWGVLAFELLAGEHPFASHTTPQAKLTAHLAVTPRSLAEQRPDLPAGLTRLIDRCLAKHPAERPADASALVAALGEPRPTARVDSRPTRYLLAATILLAAILGGGAWLYRRASNREMAREQAQVEIQRLAVADPTLAGVRLLEQAGRVLPGDSAIAHALAAHTDTIDVASSPSGARVEIQDYATPDSAWQSLGVTPLSHVRVPVGYFRWRISKDGVGEYTVAPAVRRHMQFALDSAVHAPEGMVPVPARTWADLIAFVGWVGPYELPAFFLDRFEVTNRSYQEFVDQGGYRDHGYWREKFEQQGHELTWDQAMVRFRDRTGRAGPSTWEGGHYPAGQADYPVSGVSWYEASAYAAWAGKSLPAFAQWYEAAPADLAKYTVNSSNIGRAALAPVGSFPGLGPFGTYDMAGNVREWTANALDPDRRFILGGAWNSQTYLYADPEALSPFDRSPANGIRCVRNVTPLPAGVTRPVKPLDRDFSTFKPATDDVFRAYRAMYAYVPTGLHARVEGVVQDTPDWREEKVTYDAAYGDARLAAYLFLPKKVRPPYQTVVFFPSARVLDLASSTTLGDVEFFDYVVKSGRAVLYPVYQDTYERRLKRTIPGASQERDITIQRSKDLGRSLDYLETRPDIAKNEIAYLGVSMGAAEGVIYATLAQDRLKAVIFLDGGYFLYHPPEGADQADFAPRLAKPVLMVNGRYDFSFSLERSQAPLFRMLGTPPADKRHAVLETPHDVTADRSGLVKEVLDWLDRYLGRIE